MGGTEGSHSAQEEGKCLILWIVDLETEAVWTLRTTYKVCRTCCAHGVMSLMQGSAYGKMLLAHGCVHWLKGSGSHLQSQNVRLDKNNGM